MGLDLSLTCRCCGQERASFNYTYNVSRMWHEAYPTDEGMVEIEGLTGAESILKLKQALDLLNAEPDRFIEMNPKNGWGSYEGFKKFIRELIDAAEKDQTFIWKAWR